MICGRYKVYVMIHDYPDFYLFCVLMRQFIPLYVRLLMLYRTKDALVLHNCMNDFIVILSLLSYLYPIFQITSKSPRPVTSSKVRLRVRSVTQFISMFVTFSSSTSTFPLVFNSVLSE